MIEMDAGLDGDPPVAHDWNSVASLLARYDSRASLNVATLIGNSALRIAALGWDDVPADAAALDRMRALLREGLQEGAVGLSSGLDYPPGSYATTEELAALTEEAGRSGALLPHPRPVRARRPLPGPVPGGDRDRAASRRAGPHHALLPPRDASRRVRAPARPRRRCPRRGPRRHLRLLPVRVGEHPAPHPAPGLDPGRRARPAQAAPRRADRPRPPPRGARRPGRCLHEPGRLGRRAPRRVPEPAEPPAGSRARSRT